MAELTRKYVVMAMATAGPFDPDDPDAAFVLKPWKDPAALRAMMAYRDTCYPELGRELDAWVLRIQAGAVLRGDVGQRNEPHVRAAGAAKAARRRAAAKHTRVKARRTTTHRKRRRK